MKFMRIRLRPCVKHTKIDVIITWGRGGKKKRSLARIPYTTILGATAGNEIFYYSPLLQTRSPFPVKLVS